MLLIFPVLLLGYLLLGLIVSIGVARWSSRRFQSKFAPWAVFTVLFALFFGDEIYGYWNWQNLCKTEGGVHVYKRVPVEGFFIQGSVSEGTAREHLKISRYKPRPVYQFVEGIESGQLYRFTNIQDGEFTIKKVPIAKPSSKYIFAPNNTIQHPHYVWSIEEFIYELPDRKLIAVARSFGYKGATVVRALRAMTGANFEGSANYCGSGTALLVIQAIPPSSAANK
jgi:hypothetical protein